MYNYTTKHTRCSTTLHMNSPTHTHTARTHTHTWHRFCALWRSPQRAQTPFACARVCVGTHVGILLYIRLMFRGGGKLTLHTNTHTPRRITVHVKCARLCCSLYIYDPKCYVFTPRKSGDLTPNQNEFMYQHFS